MVSLTSLAIPIILSAVIVFVVSSIIHMVLPYHRTDYKKVAKENELQDALRPFNIAPGDYVVPYAGSPEGMKNPQFIERVKKGPVLFVTFFPPGPPTMTTNLIQWFLYSVLVSLFAGYIASRALGPGAEYLDVFRFVGTSAFMGYSLGLLQNSIWYRRNWGATMKSVFDGLVYALLTAGTFGWLWPR